MSVRVKLAPMPGAPATPPADDDDALQRTFNELDHDGNGVVTVAELSGWVPTGGNSHARACH
jgi:Ca2+-binding EF-hand superfamily protein